MKSVFSVWRLEGIRRPAGPPDNLGFCSPGPEVRRSGELEISSYNLSVGRKLI
jgi:hypothetical protein